jgi:N-hydroxyarylamine O-acetyltransferase
MSTRPRIDLDAYCDRIGYRGPRTPALETLRDLQALHLAAIPFEAVDVLLGRGIDISPAAVDAKLIGKRRGGYCFEQNGLFKRALAAIGFEVEGLLARVRWQMPEDAPPTPRTHKALRVVVDGAPWLADVGFGAAVPTAPLRMDSAEPQPTPQEPFRLLPSGAAGGWRVQARLGGAWTTLYDLLPEPQLDVDYEPANWFTATHPTSPFRRSLVVARTTAHGRSTLLDGRLTVRVPGGEVETRTVLDADGIERALTEIFGLPVEPAWRAVIERAAQVSA